MPHRLMIAIFALVFPLAMDLGEARAQRLTLQLTVRGESLEGGPVHWTEDRMLMLGRDGRLFDFALGEAESYSKSADQFQPLSPSELRGQLLREFGNRFDVSGAGQYLLVHPAGQGGAWANRFDQLYRAFLRYFSVRGIEPQRPQFPLVAVVFPSQGEFLQHARQTGDEVSSNVLGYYSTRTNRILMYDVIAGLPPGSDWSANAATIIHEAAHQAAFNTGVHNRFSLPPRWLAEGLATMFEARGVWNSAVHPQLSERINRGRLAAFRKYVDKRQLGALGEFVSSDRLFDQDPDAAYAEAWALTLYLTEKEPHTYRTYLQRTAAREPFSEYPSPRRLFDFVEVFGTDLAMLEVRMLRFIATLK